MSVPFRPSAIKRYTFMLEEPRPPLMLASAMSRSSQMRVRTTAYTHSESDHIAYGVKSALGTDLRFGTVRSAAADWSRYPVGTVFRISGQPGIVYVVDDYGSALVGTGTIDLYKPSRSMMNNWGVRHVDIEVIQWGSFEKSMELMRDRTKWRHVRAMMDGIEARLRTAGVPMTQSHYTAAL
ncbi:3D domain-containing protein [Prosthecobacter vanneervenii]|uniref:3D (Asp-Asp-Asp) domain-containing protein n=1 Tax=Prosthecobacter vanneervenii TaxID=48466 RepID=A0A7W7YCK8_9BACT|nr:3D domain-containing protein [Prosthecobacter vanneervenii]MBB5033655.1 3D (Asp-Asp-Asp) domain-containing protein [Prosthecobacter vanneervenii]